MKNKIIEGQLTFSFTEPNATKYDEWSFYRNQFNAVCGGTKAVDLLYLEQQIPRAINPADVKLKLRQKVRAIDTHPLVVDQKNKMLWSVT